MTNVRRMRIELGLTQVELAQRAHVSAPTISRMESGVRARFFIDSVCRVAQALGTTVEEAFRSTELNYTQGRSPDTGAVRTLKIVQTVTKKCPSCNLYLSVQDNSDGTICTNCEEKIAA